MLSRTHKKLLTLLARGYTRKQCALLMGIKEHTVKNHMTSIRQRMDVYTSEAAIARALILREICLSDQEFVTLGTETKFNYCQDVKIK